MPWCSAENGRRIWFEERGVGTPLVLLHGWCMSSAVWALQIGALATSFRVIAPDLRGHGLSDPAPDGHDFRGFVRDLRLLFERLDLHDVLLVGWSLGAQVALQLRATTERRLHGLVLVSGTPRFTACGDFPHGLQASELQGMRVRVRRNLAKTVQEFRTSMFAAGECDEPAAVERVRAVFTGIPVPARQVALDGLSALAEGDMRDMLPELSLPTLVISGDRDTICLPEASAFMAGRIVNGMLRVFDGCGHAPFLTRYSEFNNAIREFGESLFERDQ